MSSLADVVKAGGEIDRLVAMLELRKNSCEAGTDSAREAPFTPQPLIN